jgi:hypothetical protein
MNAQSGPKQRRDLQGYVDETGVLHRKEDKFFGLGIICSPHINTLHRELLKFRNRANFHSEFKFSNVGTQNVLYYKGLLDEVFKVPETTFACLIYDKDDLSIKNHQKAYNSFCGRLISDVIISLGDNFTDYITILADDLSTSKTDHFEREIKAKVKKMTRRNAVASIIRLESHAVTEIQVCDVILGTIAYAFKVENGLVTPSKAKLQLVKYLQKKLRIPALSTSLDRKVKGVRFKVTEINSR